MVLQQTRSAHRLLQYCFSTVWRDLAMARSTCFCMNFPSLHHQLHQSGQRARAGYLPRSLLLPSLYCQRPRQIDFAITPRRLDKTSGLHRFNLLVVYSHPYATVVRLRFNASMVLSVYPAASNLKIFLNRNIISLSLHRRCLDSELVNS